MTEFVGGPVLTREQTTACELEAVNGDPNRLPELQALAAEAIAAWIAEHFNRAYPIYVVAGPGHNGGDGRIAGDLLRQQSYRVELFDIESPAPPHTMDTNCVIVDAILGTGLSGAPRPQSADWIRWVNSMRADGARVVSIDVPSGIECDTGLAHGEAVRADTTLVLGCLKPFLFANDGLEFSGNWVGLGIGLPVDGDAWDAPLLLEPNSLPWRHWSRKRAAHKGSSGHLLVVAGSDSMPGAALLCVGAALAAGAGLVTLASTPHVLAGLTSQYPEAKQCRMDSWPDDLASQFEDCDAAVIGPGLGLAEATLRSISRFLSDWRKPLVVDADALAVLDARPPELCRQTVVTPHPGEAARMMRLFEAGDARTAHEVNQNRVASADLLASVTGAITALKGPYTVVADPDRTTLNPSGNSGMATGGMGDALTGILGALLASAGESADLGELVRMGVFVHGAAADACATQIGPIGYRASDVIHAIPGIIRRFLV